MRLVVPADFVEVEDPRKLGLAGVGERGRTRVVDERPVIQRPIAHAYPLSTSSAGPTSPRKSPR